MRLRLLGAVTAITGIVLSNYSYPFVTIVAFGFFLAGLVLVVSGLALVIRGEPNR